MLMRKLHQQLFGLIVLYWDIDVSSSPSKNKNQMTNTYLYGFETRYENGKINFVCAMDLQGNTFSFNRLKCGRKTAEH